MTDATRIMLVDDTYVVLESIGAMLRHAGYDVEAHAHPIQALAAALARPPDLFLLDIDMPEINGFELCEKLKSNPVLDAIPVLFISALDAVEDKVTAFQVGAVDYVTKPVRFEELEARVRTHIELRRQAKELRENYDQLLEAKRHVDRLNRKLEQRTQFIRQTFGRYLSDDIVNELLENGDGLNFKGETREVTILIADLRGFTRLTEHLSPAQVVKILNVFMGTMAEVVAIHGGTIGDFIGDALMVIFGAPLRCNDHARKAVVCALAMQRAMDKVNSSQELAEVEMGIGINTGEVVVGNVGSARHAKYGVVGFQVNLAARIESYSAGRQILMSASTERSVRGEFPIDGSVMVQPKGLERRIQVYFLRTADSVPPGPHPLNSPIPVSVSIVADKQVCVEPHSGDIVALSECEAEIRTKLQVEPLTELEIKRRCGTSEATYAHVTDTAAGRLRVRFTESSRRPE